MNGDDRVSFEYNADGIRTEKTLSGGYTEKYLLDGDKVVEIVRQGFEVDDRCVITYDESGNPFSLERVWSNSSVSKYYYVFNLQGDVIQLRTADGTIVANYVYDAWGKPVSVTGDTVIANRNPLRYRGYFYDTETGLYYCNSRYYDPEVKRWINADGYITTGQGFASYNMFAYCLNNPVMYVDFGGDSPEAVLNWWCTLGIPLTVVDGPLPIGDIVFFGGCFVVGTIVFVSASIETIKLSCDNPMSLDDDNDKADLPNQGEVTEIPDAPPVDAGKQGKHVPGHNNFDPEKSQWDQGENGVRQTQEAWNNGTPDRGNPDVRIGESSDGRTVRVHRAKNGRIHGYPIDMLK